MLISNSDEGVVMISHCAIALYRAWWPNLCMPPSHTGEVQKSKLFVERERISQIQASRNEQEKSCQL